MSLYRTPQRKQALTYLHDLGAHFVLCRRSRQPIRGFPWGSHKPALDCVLAHPSHVGIVPFSVNTSALDVDRGKPTQLSLFWPPLVAVSSRQPGREHLYYRDDTPRGNQQWRAFGCAGEVRSAKGYLILYRDAPVHLAHALCQRHGEMSRFRQDKMSHFLHVKKLQPGWLPRSSLALLLLHRDTEHPRLALGLEPVALALDVDRCRVV